MQPQVIIISAPSGSGKSTIIGQLLERRPDFKLKFSVSATSRAPRGEEREGEAYYFLTTEAFQARVAAGDFLEYEEVYPGCFYGTLASEVERLTDAGYRVVFDIDVKGAMNLKRQFGRQALSIFIAPPSVETLRERLTRRATDSAEMIERRVAKAAEEMAYASQFDACVVNDVLDVAVEETIALIDKFLSETSQN